VINREWDSATHSENLYERSDHFNYARKGIPIVFFTTGLHAEYHRPGDEAQRIDYDKLARVSRLIRDAVMAVGDGARRPR
jgi:Zn-dependent M28 family amino/carboxypeptidase